MEALIAGWGLGEALKRAEAYWRAGADAILMHSKHSTAFEILEFMGQWGGVCPVVIVPTMYYKTPTSVFEKHGISTVIWANQLLRAGLKAMQETARDIANRRSLMGVEDRISSVQEIFRLQDTSELLQAERRYLPEEVPFRTSIPGVRSHRMTARKKRAPWSAVATPQP